MIMMGTNILCKKKKINKKAGINEKIKSDK